MSEASTAEWLAAFSAAFAAVAAVGALWIARLQWLATRRQADIALLEKRHAVFRQIGGAISSIAREASVNSETELALREASHWTAPLFGSTAGARVYKLWHVARYWMHFDEMQESYGDLGKKGAALFQFAQDEWRHLEPLMLAVLTRHVEPEHHPVSRFLDDIDFLFFGPPKS